MHHHRGFYNQDAHRWHLTLQSYPSPDNTDTYRALTTLHSYFSKLGEVILMQWFSGGEGQCPLDIV